MRSESSASERTTSAGDYGRCDLLVRNYYTGELLHVAHRGALDGLSTYADPTVVRRDFGGRSVQWFGAGDLTGDGGRDIVVAAGSNCLILRRPRGGDPFEPTRVDHDLSPASYHSLVLGEVDDGRVGIVGRRSGTGQVDAMLAHCTDGVIGFGPPRTLATVAVTDYLIGLARITGGGRPDLVVSRLGGETAIYEFDAATVEGGQWHPLVRVPPGVRMVAVTDIDDDGCPDLLATRSDGTLIAYRHRGAFAPDRPLSTFLEPVVVARGWGEFDLIA